MSGGPLVSDVPVQRSTAGTSQGTAALLPRLSGSPSGVSGRLPGMSIPGLAADLPIAAKIRCGVFAGGRPQSTDYFVIDGENVGSEMEIQFPYPDAERTWKSSLEWWKSGKAPLLACYTVGEEVQKVPVAYRMPKLVDDDDKVAGSTGSGRTIIKCRATRCPHQISKECKPKGRLVCVWTTDLDRILQLETGSWGSIKQIEGAMLLASRKGDLTNRTFKLSVSFQRSTKGKFPVVNLREV